MADVAICNASPLIFLARGRHLSLLTHFYSSVLLPIPVADELAARGPEDETVRTLQQTTWLQTAPAEHVPDSVASWGLGPGESAVVALALVTPGCEALMKGVDIFTVSRLGRPPPGQDDRANLRRLSGRFRAEQMAKVTIGTPRMCW